jgi:hypothetical protein
MYYVNPAEVAKSNVDPGRARLALGRTYKRATRRATEPAPATATVAAE